jgi:hypothetical protein
MDKLQEQIAKRAYELFQARGGIDGYHIQDWLQAEKEVTKASVASDKFTAPASVSASIPAPAMKAPEVNAAPKVKQAEPLEKSKIEKAAAPAKKMAFKK